MNERITIAIDAMGGDHGPQETVKGAQLVLEQRQDVDLILVGREEEIAPHVSEEMKSRVRILHAPEVIETGEDPLIAIRKKRNSSMIVALGLLKTKEAQAVVSAGSTGAFMSGAFFYSGRVKGVQRPALAPIFPTKRGGSMLIDVGANAECTPEFLMQFAHMGSIYMKNVQGIANPRVGLINIGAEEEKGTPLYKETNQLLKKSGLNFVGNVEPRDIPEGLADVLVCDGFSGNMVLKSYEGAMFYLFDLLKAEMTSSLMNKIAAAILKSSFRKVKKQLDYNEVGGAPLIGIDGVAVKAHGSSKAVAFSNAVLQAAKMTETGVVEAIRGEIQSIKSE